MKKVLLCLGCISLATACGKSIDTSADVNAPESDALTIAPAGSIPTGLPSRLLVGLFEDWGGTWMKTSGVPWDVRYAYFVKGWVNNWGYGAADGSMATTFFQQSDALHTVPAVAYYQMNGEAGGGEDQFFNKTKNAATMKSYFTDFKTLMQRAKDFSKPVIVMLEGDGFAYMEIQSGNNPNAYSAVADTGLPELAGLPNTAAGWGLAFLQIRKAVGANNVVLGVHVSSWASGKDISYVSVTDPLQPEVTKVQTFLNPLGLSSNVTGATYDFMVGDPNDRDSDYYRLVVGTDRWWDASDSASISSKSFNRYAEWLRLFNVATNKRWVLWQIPLGNSNHLNVANTGKPREGYKDNRPEYFFATSDTTHLQKFASVGVVALLFGAGATGQSSFQNDIYADGQPFMQNHAGAFLRGGGLAIPAGAGMPPVTLPPNTDSALYNFESGTQSWTSSGAPVASVSASTTQAFAGTHSLAVNFSGAAGTASAIVNAPSVGASKTVTFHVWLPAKSAITAVQPFLLQGASGNWAWTGNWQATSTLKLGAWNTITVVTPSNAAAFFQLGVQFQTNVGASTAFVDSVSW